MIHDAMRRLLSAAALLPSVLSVACASSGAVPHPFPSPGPSPRPAAAIPAEAAPVDGPEPVSADPGLAVASTALTYRGVPYRNGGTDPDAGFDCSGLVWYAFAQNGRPVPRTVAELFRSGTSVEDGRVRAGDLVFFNTTGVSPSHVGIAISDAGFVHAPSTRGEVRVERLDGSYWSGRLVGIRRME